MTTNYVRDIVEAAPAEAPALVELARDGARRVWTFGEIGAAAARLPRATARQLEFVERLPKTASGKIKRAELRRG